MDSYRTFGDKTLVLCSIRRIRLDRALRLARAVPARHRLRTRQDGELSVDLLHSCIDAELLLLEAEDRRDQLVPARRSLNVTSTDRVHTKNRQDDLQLPDEVVHVGPVRFGKRLGRRRGAVVQNDSTGLLGKGDEARL